MSRLKYFLIAAVVVVLAAVLSLLLVLGEGTRRGSFREEIPTPFSLSTGESSSPVEQEEGEEGENEAEMRAIWLSFYDWKAFTTGKDLAGFREAFSHICNNIAAFGLNTLIVQVRAFDDAMYPSQYFPWSQYASGVLGQAPDYDPLEQMVEIAHQKGLAIHAWINPYRIRSGEETALIEGYSAAIWQAEGNGYVLSHQGGLYYNPAVPQVQQLILSGVKEILDHYPVDGIHFDDYFYPTADPSFDEAFYLSYQQQGGALSQMEWREENVNQLIRSVYALVQEDGKGRVFGISPAGNLDYNRSTLSADVALWCSEEGYVDYICPQLYFGFENSTVPFAQSAARWSQLVMAKGVALYIGLGPYKIGTLDKWAGEGQQEWLENNDLLARQLQCIRQLPNCGGFALFRYASLFYPESTVEKAVEEEKHHFFETLCAASSSNDAVSSET